MPVDSRGVYIYSNNDVIQDWASFLNLGSNAVSNVIRDTMGRLVYVVPNQAAIASKVVELGNKGVRGTTPEPLVFYLMDQGVIATHNGSTTSLAASALGVNVASSFSNLQQGPLRTTIRSAKKFGGRVDLTFDFTGSYQATGDRSLPLFNVSNPCIPLDVPRVGVPGKGDMYVQVDERGRAILWCHTTRYQSGTWRVAMSWAVK